MNCLLPWRPRLKLRIRENALRLEVSERALRVGEGGESSGRGKSWTGIFQKLKSLNSGALL